VASGKSILNNNQIRAMFNTSLNSVPNGVMIMDIKS
jgi:hypothetical protein